MKFYISLVAASLVAFTLACSGDSEGSAPASPTTSADSAVSPESTATTAATAVVQPSATAEPTATTEATAPPQPTTTPEPQASPLPTTPPQPRPTTPSSPPPATGGFAAPIRGYGFPYQLHVPAGSTVVWTNNDAVPHDVTEKDDAWSSGILTQGQSYSRSFSSPGTYAYVCRLHPYMTAVLIVE